MTKANHLVLATLLAILVASCASSRSSAPPADPASAPRASPEGATKQDVPEALRFIEGRWQSMDPANQFQMTVTWNQAAGQFEGVLSANGRGSAEVGFKVGELVWKAKPAADGTLREEQLWRSGLGGVSMGSQWKEGTVKLADSTPERLVTTFATFTRLP